MAKKPGGRPQAMKARAAKTAAAISPSSALAADAPPKKRTNPIQFFQEVRAEGRKITWTSWKETWITSVMVFIMVALAAIFFFVIDMGIGWSVRSLLDFANSGA